MISPGKDVVVGINGKRDHYAPRPVEAGLHPVVTIVGRPENTAIICPDKDVAAGIEVNRIYRSPIRAVGLLPVVLGESGWNHPGQKQACHKPRMDISMFHAAPPFRFLKE